MRDSPVHPSEIDREGLREDWNALHVMMQITDGVINGESYHDLCDHAITIYGQEAFRKAQDMAARLADDSHSPLDVAPRRKQLEIIRSLQQ